VSVNLVSLSWPELAACVGSPALFFGPDAETAPERHRRVRKAREVCASCPVRRDCLAFARESQIAWGVWGGADFEHSLAGGDMCRNELHVMDEANTFIDGDGHRICRACLDARNERQRDALAARRAA
jgi:transcription factor WhiB